ncbi:LON peptidase substrate-binding domain-containing protein [Sulfuriferula sp. AH1]|uniref:LON peptidase substrate-binding domain-containing protein n=1 Tax=Sulfuriferula sp. AH1 TaxID=1985873 RepID=UPI001CB96DDC|nr:LON peptidase substrate-binding domain-containing protein [Sulfuriferula sp. AH1]
MSWFKRSLPLMFDRLHNVRHLSIPIFPMHTVLYPDGLLPLKIFETRYMDMAKTCLKDNAPFGVCLIQAGEEVGAPAVPHSVGTLAHIADWDMPQLGILNITAQGGQRFLIESSETGKDGLITAEVSLISAEATQLVTDEFSLCSTVFETIVQELGTTRFSNPMHPEQAVWLGYRLAESLPIKASAKQDLLEMNDSLMRLKIIQEFLKRQGVLG